MKSQQQMRIGYVANVGSYSWKAVFSNFICRVLEKQEFQLLGFAKTRQDREYPEVIHDMDFYILEWISLLRSSPLRLVIDLRALVGEEKPIILCAPLGNVDPVCAEIAGVTYLVDKPERDSIYTRAQQEQIEAALRKVLRR